MKKDHSVWTSTPCPHTIKTNLMVVIQWPWISLQSRKRPFGVILQPWSLPPLKWIYLFSLNPCSQNSPTFFGSLNSPMTACQKIILLWLNKVWISSNLIYFQFHYFSLHDKLMDQCSGSSCYWIDNFLTFFRPPSFKMRVAPIMECILHFTSLYVDSINNTNQINLQSV